MKTTKLLFLLLFGLGISQAKAQYTEIIQKDQVSALYKWKTDKEGKKQLLIKFKNKSKSPQNINLELGFFLTGIKEETAQVSACAQGSFFANLFPTVYGIYSETLTNEQLEQVEIGISPADFQLEKTEKCEKQHQ